MIGNFPEVLIFNWLFLKLNRFIYNWLPVLPDHWWILYDSLYFLQKASMFVSVAHNKSD